jgi:hypothetical protein
LARDPVNNYVTIWIQRWSDVLETGKLRYEFFRNRLEVQASKDHGMTLLKTRHEHLLSGRGVRKAKDLKTMGEKQIAESRRVNRK